MSVAAVAIAEVLGAPGGPPAPGRPATSMRGFDEAVRAGVPKLALERLQPVSS